MTEDRELQAEIRATLERIAGRPAPERLLARVAAIPTEAPASGRLSRSGVSPLRLGFSLAGAGFAMVLIVGALLLRGGFGQGSGGPSPSGPVPSTAGTPTPTPGASSSAATTTPTPSGEAVAPSPSVSAVGPIPADFKPLSVTFVSADMGWVLGSTGCGSERCPVIVNSVDGGRTWARVEAPATTVSTAPELFGGLPTPTGVTEIRFADRQDGWIFGPDLWATHDGGQTWKQVAVPGLAGAPVVALEASAGTVHAAFWDETGVPFRLATSPVGSDAWRLSPTDVPVGAGPVPSVQLVLAGTTGWLLENDRTVIAGARLVGGTWQTWQPPCLDVVGPALLAAGTAQDLIAACDVGLWATPQGEHLYRSTDSGQTFAEAGPRLPVDSVTAIGAPNASTIVAAGGGSNGVAEVVASYDGGHTWTVVLRPGQAVTYLGFTTATQGVMLTSGAAGHGQLLMTRDGGRTWATVPL